MANIDKLAEILNSEKCAEELKACTTKEAVLAYLNDKGADVTEADMKEIVDEMFGKEALSDEDLAPVSGGGALKTMRKFYKWVGNTAVDAYDWFRDLF